MESSEKNSTEERSRQNFPCGLCPFEAKTKESLDKHAGHHVLNPDAEFVCKKCPFYCSSKIELGIHAMVHAFQRRSLESETEIPEKKLKVDTEQPSVSPTQARSRMSPFKRSVSLSPNQKQLKKTLSVGQVRECLDETPHDPSDSGNRASPLWKVKPLFAGSPSASDSSPSNKKKKGFQCDSCPYIAHSHKEMETHHEKHSPAPDRPFKCDLCSYYAVNNAAIINHKRVHTSFPKTESENGDVLDDDNMSVSTKTGLPSIEKTNRKSTIICSLCPQTFTVKGNIHKHLKLHTTSPSRPFRCCFCSFCCSSSGKLKVHTNLHNEQEDDNSNMDLESTVDDVEDNSDDEIGEEAESENKYKCKTCPYSTKYLRLIKTHRMQHTPSEERQACCPYCPYYVTVKSALTRHLAVHKEHQHKGLDESQNGIENEGHESEEALAGEYFEESDMEDSLDDGSCDEDETEAKYRCGICPYTTPHRRLIKVHTEQHKPSEERQACCPYCPYYVSKKRYLIKHLEVHEEHKNQAVKDDEKSDTEEESMDTAGNDTDQSDDEPEAEDETDTNEKIFSCYICPYTTPHRRLIKIHTAKHTPSIDRQARCDYCPYYGSVKSLLGKHMMVHKEYRDLKGIKAEDSVGTGADNTLDDDEDDDDTTVRQCNLCPYLATSGHSLKRHKTFHTGTEERQVQCPYCPYFVKSQARLANHIVVHSEHFTEKESDSDESSEEVINCSVCPFMSSSREDMEVHEKHHLSNEDQPNKCPHCNYYARDSTQIEHHAKLHLKQGEENYTFADEKKSWTPRWYACDICPYKGHDPKYIVKHQELHEPSEERKYKCQFCPFYVKTRNGVTHHQRLHLAANKDDVIKRKVEEKIPVANENQYISCSVCPFKTEYPTEYRKHITHHKPSDEFPIKCRYCPFYAAIKNGLARHITLHPEYHVDKLKSVGHIHTTLHPEYHVDKLKSVAKKDDDAEIGNHEIDQNVDEDSTEFGDTSMQNCCPICPYTGQPGKLKRHMEMHAPSERRQAKCPHCPFYVERSASLGSHIQVHTGGRRESKSKGKDDIDEDVTHFKSDYYDIGGESMIDEYGTNEPSDDSGNELENNEEGKGKPKTKVNKYQCTSCPYVARKPELEIHILGHKPNPKNIFQCSLCTYAGSNKASLNMHLKVHQPDYISNQAALYRVHLDANQMGESAPASPAKSDISDVSDCDILEMANIKQQLITAKIISTPVAQDRFQPGTRNEGEDDACVVEGLFVDKNGDMQMGLFRTMIRCRYCPYCHIHTEELQQHEQMHRSKSGKYRCCYCTYKSDHKILRNRHMRVHAYQYVPGARQINDYDCEPEEETDEDEEDEEEEMEVSFKEPTASDDDGTVEESKSDMEKSDNKATDTKESKSAEKSPDGNSIRIRSKPLLSLSDMPPGIEYYVRQDKVTGESYLERASVKKWCCEKCPYASMDKDRFENHVMLHASHQRNVCEFCDYSVPVYNFLLEHRKLHLKPNPNLLAMQSVTNLLSLPEVPADVAAAANFPGETDDPISQFGTHDDMDLYENSDQYTEPRKLYHCDRCPYTNVRRDNLLSHLRFHMIKNELTCDYCDYSVDKQELLVQHVRVHFVDPNTIKLDHNSNPIISSTSKEKPVFKPVLKDTANVGANPRPSSAKKANAKKGKTEKMVRKPDNGEEDMNNNSSSWICQYCDRAFDESDRLLRHEMQHLIGQRV